MFIVDNIYTIHNKQFPIQTDWWNSDGNNTSITKIDKKLSEEENKKKIKSTQEKFYKKYTNYIDKNRLFYNQHKNLLDLWLIKSRKETLWTDTLRKMEWQTWKNNLNMNEVLQSTRSSGIRIKNIDYTPTLVAMTSMIPIYGPKSRYLTP